MVHLELIILLEFQILLKINIVGIILLMFYIFNNLLEHHIVGLDFKIEFRLINIKCEMI